MNTLRVTLDTGALSETQLSNIRLAAAGLKVEFRNTTVSDRELEEAYTQPLEQPLLETAVLGEGRLDFMVLGGDNEPALFESILNIIGSDGFPQRGNREALSIGHQHQLRDALILLTHTREHRDVLVTLDKKAYIGGDESKRRALEALCDTRIMTPEEFAKHCKGLCS